MKVDLTNVRRAPTFKEIRNRRIKFNMTQAEAAEYVYVGARMWQFYEYNVHRMSKAMWELFVNKTIYHGKLPRKK